MSRQSAAEKILRIVPDEFTRKDVLDAGKKLNYSYSTASSATQKMLYMDLAERVEKGKYRKLDQSINPNINQ